MKMVRKQIAYSYGRGAKLDGFEGVFHLEEATFRGESAERKSQQLFAMVSTSIGHT